MKSEAYNARSFGWDGEVYRINTSEVVTIIKRIVVARKYTRSQSTKIGMTALWRW